MNYWYSEIPNNKQFFETVDACFSLIILYIWAAEKFRSMSIYFNSDWWEGLVGKRSSLGLGVLLILLSYSDSRAGIVPNAFHSHL